MRLPFLDGRRERIDVPLATEMLHYALDHGVNYVDTAFPYHSATFDGTPGNSEGFLGDALAAGGTATKCFRHQAAPLGGEVRERTWTAS